MAKTRPTPAEQKALMQLFVLEDGLKEATEPLAGRIAADPFALRGLKAARTSINRAINAVTDGLDDKSLMYIAKNTKSHEVVIRPKSVVPETAWMYARTDDLRVILRAAQSAECAMCLKTPGEEKRCPLKKAMQEIVDEPEAAFGCGYRRIMEDE